MLSSPLRRVITQMLQSYLARYIKNISLEGAPEPRGALRVPLGLERAWWHRYPRVPTHSMTFPRRFGCLGQRLDTGGPGAAPGCAAGACPGCCSHASCASVGKARVAHRRCARLQEMIPSPLGFSISRGFIKVRGGRVCGPPEPVGLTLRVGRARRHRRSCAFPSLGRRSCRSQSKCR